MKKNKLILISGCVLLLFLSPYFYERYKVYSFLESNPYYMNDSLAGHAHSAHYLKKIKWIEHPGKEFTIYTNNLGFRNDSNTNPICQPHTYRVLVTGDSHMDGVLNNHENFAYNLQNGMDTTDSDMQHEVLNGGTGYYSFKNYVGFLKKNLYLKPDLYIVAVYTGNDFFENILYDESNNGFIPSWKMFLYRINRSIQLKNIEQIQSQALCQQLYFWMYPSQKQVSMNLAKKYLGQIQMLCKTNNIKLLVILIPSKFDVESPLRRSIQQKLNWNDQEMDLNSSMTNELSSWLAQQKIDHLDPLDQMRNSQTSLYWEADHHLNINGHKLLAALVLDHLKK